MDSTSGLGSQVGPILAPAAANVASRQSEVLQRLQTARGRKRSTNIGVACRTCRKCRSKKVKCDGSRPACGLCLSSKSICTYPQDARRSGRPTKAEIEDLKNEVVIFRRLFNEQRVQKSIAARPSAPGMSPEGHEESSLSQAEALETQREEVNTPFQSTTLSKSPGGNYEIELNSPKSRGTSIRDSFSRSRPGQSHGTAAVYSADETIDERNERIGAISPLETEIACVVAEDGSIKVHGVASHLHQPSAGIMPVSETTELDQEMHIQMVKDQLFANAALQRQREGVLLGVPSHGMGIQIDLDGLAPELAIHLLELHWNRQHHAYLLSYRPAIIESLSNNGPHANKLLLNAIYYSSCLYSDRTIFRSNVNDAGSMGEGFYKRFKELLIDEIDRPSLPTVAALLICGTTLVSNGKQSAGWVLCGIAYRMVVDLGCHLSISARPNKTAAETRLTSLEVEMRTRIYWGAFLTDKFQSLYLGRPCALRPADALASKVLLDYYEELENWTPYIDPLQTTAGSVLSIYRPRPAYSVSTFQALIPLGEIANAIASTFYAIDCIKIPRDQLLAAKWDIQNNLERWLDKLPNHLHFDPAIDPVPPPNQITPHATYHTLRILLERPFLSNGHLASPTDRNSHEAGSALCVDAALRIWHLLEAYKRTFTLRRAPYLLSYAAHSAIVIMLNQTHNEDSQYVDCIRFFWFALLDFQKGCNSGLVKPLKILQTLMQRLGQNIPHWDPKEDYLATRGAIGIQHQAMNNHDQNMSSITQVENADNPSEPGLGDIPGLDYLLQQNMDLEGWDNERWMDTTMTDQGLLDDSLFGLFTLEHPIMKGFG